MNLTTSYAHHFFAKGCELAGCDAPDRRCDLYLIEGERRAVRACCGAHARSAAVRQELDAEIERAAEQAARMKSAYPPDAVEDLDAWLDRHAPDLGSEWSPEEAR